MPDVYGDVSTTPTPTMSGDYAASSMSSMQEIAKSVVPNDYGAAATALGAVAFAPADLVDVVGSSIGLTNRGQINDTLLNLIDSPGLKDYHAKVQGATEIASGALGLVGSEIVAAKLISNGSKFASVLSKVPVLNRAVALDEQYQTAMSTVRAVDMGLARAGALGGEQFVGKAAVDGVMVARNQAANTSKILNAAMGVRHAAVFESVNYLTQNTNASIYTDSAALNMAFAAAGLGIGAGANWLLTGYALRKGASDAELIRAQIGALDPLGSEEKRIAWRIGQKAETSTELNAFGGRQTDEITSLLLESQGLRGAEITGGVDARQLMSNRDRLSTQNLQQAREKINSVTVKGLSHDGRTRFTLGTQSDSRSVAGAVGYSNHISEIMNRDPAAFYLVEQMGGAPEGLGAAEVADMWRTRLTERQTELEVALRKDKLARDVGEESDDILTPEKRRNLRQLRLQLAEESRQTPFVFIDGERLPISEAAVIDNYTAPTFKDFEFVPDANRPAGRAKGPVGFWSVKRPTSETTIGTIDNNLTMTLTTGKSFADLDHYDVLHMYKLGERVATQLANSAEPIIIRPGADWFTLDLAERVLQKTKGEAPIVWPEGMTRESAQVESYAQKAEELNRKMYDRIFAPVTGARVLDPEAEMARLRVRFNMPRLTAYEMGVTGASVHPAMALLRGANEFGPQKIRQMALPDLKEAIAEFSRLGDKVPLTAKDVDTIMGNSFTYMLDRNGQEMKPIIGTMRPAQRVEWIPDNVAERVAQQAAVKMNMLLSDTSDPFTRLLAKAMQDNPDAVQAAMTHELRETQMMGAITGSAPNSFIGAASNALSTSEFAARDAPVILAAGRMRDTLDRISNNLITKMFSETFGTTLNELANPRNAKSTLLLDQFHSAAGGWELAERPIKRDGLNVFPLSQTEANNARWKERYGVDMPKGAVLTAPNGVVVALDDLALRAQQQYNQLTTALVNAKNSILRSQGMKEITTRSWYVAPPNTKGKFIGFTYDPYGEPVRDMTIVASTQDEYAKKLVAMQPALDKLGPGYTVRSMDDIQQFGSIWDRAIADMLDPGTTAVQAGKKSQGLLNEQWTRPGAFSEGLVNMRKQFSQHGRDLIQTQYDASIKAAQARSQISQAMTPRGGGLFNRAGFKNIHDIYLENLLGKSKVYDSKSLMGGVYNGVEGTIDKFLTAATPTAKAAAQSAGRVWEATTAWLARKNPFSQSAEAKRDFETLRDALGKYMPFESAAQMAEAQGFSARPWTTQSMASSMSSFAATAMLRFAETSHAMVNLGGIVAANPAVIRFFSKQSTESVEDYLGRIGHTGLAINVDGRDPIGMLDMVKITKRGIRAALDPKNHELYDDMVARGMLSQEIAELHKQYGLVNGRDSWGRFFLGDPAMHNPKGVKDKFMSKGVVGWMSILTDKSEDFTRTIATMTGHELAKEMGIVTKEGRLSFAHDVANKLIANYTPANRPEVFQGAMGTTLGLFQSFIQNYYQRMFRYVETQNWKAFADQYIWQGAVFGIPSVPGWGILNSAYSSLSTDHQDATGKLRDKASAAADLLQGGALSNLPTLFGAPAINYYTRGDVNARVPGSQLFAQAPKDATAIGTIASMSPALSIMMKVHDAISQAAGAFWNSHNEMTGAQVAEILANTIPNRPIAGMVEQLLAGGNSTDRMGQLVADTRGAMESIYRMMGVRSMRQSSEIEAYYANKAPMEHKAAADYQLRVASRAAIRDGKFNELYDVFQNQYLNNGGDPRYFRRWVKEQYEAALLTRGERQLKSALANPARAGEVNRLLDVGIPITDENAERQKLEAFYNAIGADQNDETGETQGQMYDPSLSGSPEASMM